MDAWKLLLARLPKALGAAVDALNYAQRLNLEEIRVYRDANPEFVIAGENREIPAQVDMRELLACLSAQALYSCERQMAEGYIPLAGGHRAGVCGQMTRDSDGTWRMADVYAVCIRIGRLVRDASLPLRPFLLDRSGRVRRVLILGAPGSGKTTILRDAALWLSEKGLHVAVADERGELFAGSHGRLNVLSGMDKAGAFSMLLRSMAPQVIVSDEIGSSTDTQAVLDCVRCGVGLLVSAHAASMEEAACRPAIRQMLEQKTFDWYVLLGCRAGVMAIYDRNGKRWEEKELGQLGCGRDGDDRCQRGGLSAFGC